MDGERLLIAAAATAGMLGAGPTLPRALNDEVYLATGIDVNRVIAESSPRVEEPPFALDARDLVRWDNPAIKVPLHPEWIVDDPPAYDKRDFRVLAPRPFVAGQVYVRFKPGTSGAAKAAAHAWANGAEVLWTSQVVPDLHCVSVKGLSVEDAVVAYLDAGQVLYAEPSYVDEFTANPNDPGFALLWGLQGNGGDPGGSAFGCSAQWAWDEYIGNPEFIIAVIDSSVQVDHVDLYAVPQIFSNLWFNWLELFGFPGVDDDGNGFIDDVNGWNVADGNGNVGPCNANDYHGTHVAGTVGAIGNNNIGVTGVNWLCEIMVLRTNGVTNGCSGGINTVQALQYALLHGAKVSNNSYGGLGMVAGEYDMILAAQAFGHIFVAAAGNSTSNNDFNPFYPASYDLANIIAVVAHQFNGTLADYSNFGATSTDLAAPGGTGPFPGDVNVYSTVPFNGYGYAFGTSMASPHVAGAVALLWGREPELTWTQVVQRLLATTTPAPSLAGKCVTGGRLNVLAAMGYWLDPNYGFGPSNGSKSLPWKAPDWATAYGAVPAGGRLNLKTGSVPKASMGAATTLDKPMELRAHGGPAVLGQ